MKLFGIRDSILRRAALSLFRRVNPGDVKIKHHWVPSKDIALHSFKHKGYWWHKKNREKETIDRFFKLIDEGDTVIEVGGHIGYMSIIYSSLVGKAGKLFVFEPGTNNLKYIEQNLANEENTSLVKEAVSNVNGDVELYIEDLSGQNNSIIKDYHLLKGNIALSGINDVKLEATKVPCVTLDTFVGGASIIKSISFIKIDIEGAELMALQGAKHVLGEYKPNMMVEITRDYKEVFDLLMQFQYSLYTPSGESITNEGNMNGNVFCLNSEDSIKKYLQ